MRRAFGLLAAGLLVTSALATSCSCQKKPVIDAKAQVEAFGFALTEDNWVDAYLILAPWLNDAATAADGKMAIGRALAGHGYDFTPVVQEMNVTTGTTALDALENGFDLRGEITEQNYDGWGAAELIWEADSAGSEPKLHLKLLLVKTANGVRVGSYAFGNGAP